MKYELYDLYETGIKPGELICASDDLAEVKAAAKLWNEETDGECALYIMEQIDRDQKEGTL